MEVNWRIWFDCYLWQQSNAGFSNFSWNTQIVQFHLKYQLVTGCYNAAQNWFARLSLDSSMWNIVSQNQYHIHVISNLWNYTRLYFTWIKKQSLLFTPVPSFVSIWFKAEGVHEVSDLSGVNAAMNRWLIYILQPRLYYLFSSPTRKLQPTYAIINIICQWPKL